MVHDPVFSLALDRNNLALKRIVDLVSCRLASFIRNFSHPSLPTNGVGLYSIFFLRHRFASLYQSAHGFIDPLGLMSGFRRARFYMLTDDYH
jgi:hypothetical protein